ncbi:hypothetical protein F4781DRAFT_399854 [Annulohypoxylon bovei var. microspora]|nr:hypothetical protein F4781DRAFT_399854 [Annulohypoxylon bovei var. microspora]
MAETSGASYRKDKKQFKELSDEKVKQIYIWRTEVTSSDVPCACSKPTIPEPDPVSRSKSKSKGKGKGKGKAVARRGTQQISGSSSTAMDSDNQPEPLQERTNPFHSHGPLSLKYGLFIREETPCPMCEAPIDSGVIFTRIGARGEKALVRGNPSPRSASSLRYLSDVVSYDQYKTPPKAWLKKTARKPLNHIKRAITPEDEKSKGKQVLKPLLRLLRRSSMESLDSSVEQPLTVRPRATEMYHTLPSNAESSGAGSVETLLSGLSDDERRRPKLTIDESAARLRRAQRLLAKQSKDESKA